MQRNDGNGEPSLKRIKTAIDALTSEVRAQRAEDHEWRKTDKWPRRTAWAVIAYTALTFIIMVIYGCQNYLIRSHNVISQRAFVSFSFGQFAAAWSATPNKISRESVLDALTQGSTAINAVSFIVDITNSGNTGTKNLTFFLKCAPTSEDLQEPWSVLYQGKNNAAKAPQFIGPHATIRSACGFNIEQIKAMSTGKAFGYVMIDTTYQDRLTNDWHRTEATMKVGQIEFIPGVAPSGSGSLGLNVALVTYGRHNCADEECPSD